ncbi:Lactation elevated protein 1 B [Candida viswanathii]|uniref:Lactation elevated protein 1 B n=1 Tax=Candida viswanathii TaxID=5486 RepID=A0A367YCP5_9ASCO|nr:Lactation elevated protein 1 B [Candida viswanathii]
MKILIPRRLHLQRPLSTRRAYSTITGGLQGVDGREPVNFYHKEEHALRPSSALSVTDPYVIYQSYIHQGLLEKDESQLRVMKEFQKLYHRVMDYSPPEELLIKFKLLVRQIEANYEREQRSTSVYSPLKLFRKDPETSRMQIVRYMTDEEELRDFASPQGLLINGEVGCGKSMLMDIFAACLPYESKMRWHYNNFILWVFSEMHHIQQKRMRQVVAKEHKYSMENEFLLYEVAQKMIQKNTVLMLDEFVLPDIASANIIKILFTFYFKLGGVLVATSNKLPEELYSTKFNKQKFKDFVGILHARCHSIDMSSEKDYRTYFANESKCVPHMISKKDNAHNDREWLRLIKERALKIPADSKLMDDKYSLFDLGGEPTSVSVYGRTTKIPQSFNDGSVCYLDFEDICQGLYYSSDYITIASTFKTIILDNVPVMTTKKKNEARRFITLLDAIYESRCQFFMRSEVDIDYLFFPEVQHADNKELIAYLKDHLDKHISGEVFEVQDEEAFARASIDLTNPYRPNVSTYDQSYTKSFDDFEDNKNEQNNYTNTKAFTGDDEKFAFKRAVSRIKEMVASEFWRAEDRWVPLDSTMRPWETPAKSKIKFAKVKKVAAPETSNPDMDKFLMENDRKKLAVELADSLPRDYAASKGIPFRLFNSKIAPRFDSLQHFWAMGKWTLANGQRLKDSISRSWLISSIRGDDEKSH